MAYVRTAQNHNRVTCSCMSKVFYFALWLRSAGRSAQTYEKLFFIIFRRLGPFPQAFGQVKGWLILELHEMIRVPHVVVCPMDFNLPCDRGQQQKMIIFRYFQSFACFILKEPQTICIYWFYLLHNHVDNSTKSKQLVTHTFVYP